MVRGIPWVVVALCLVLVPSVHASFGCEIRASCLGNQTLFLRLNSSESGSAPNNSHAQLANYSGVAYPYSVCCWVDGRTVTNACEAASMTVLRLNQTSDSHVEAGNMSTAVYGYKACLNVTGTLACEYPMTACASGYSSVVSIASSESGDGNLTNAHVADPGFYLRKVCCRLMNTPPVITSLVVNSTNGRNSTAQNLTAYYATYDVDGDNVRVIHDWRVNGTSIAVLNMNFDVNDSAGTGYTRDYSTFGHIVRNVNGILWNATGGLNGTGAYNFSGTGYLNVSHNDSFDFGVRNFSLELRVRVVDNTTANQALLSHYQTSPGWFLKLFHTGGNTVALWDGVNYRYPAVRPPLNNGQWYHLIVSRNGTDLQFYLDGVNYGNSSVNTTIGQASVPIRIGQQNDGSGNFMGQLDDIRIYNRTLSAAQVLNLYRNQSNIIDQNETTAGDNWTDCVTANDGQNDSVTSCSAGLIITGKTRPSNVTLLYPFNGNTTVFERFVNLSWTAADEADGDAVNYTVNVTVAAGSCAVQSVLNVQTTNRTYGELCTDQVYWWNVSACDVDGCSGVNQTFNFTIASVLDIALIGSNTSFGDLSPGQSKTTDSYNVTPFLVRNDGNVPANLTLVGNNSPFTSVGLGDTAFQFKAADNESGSINASGSQASYTPVPASFVNAVRQLNYSDASDTVAVHINVTVPADEPAGAKRGNVTFLGVAS